jgi:hypothetical protein
MNNIIKTVENFNPLINNVKEYYKEEDIVKENYKNDDFSLIGSIISLTILVMTIYLWIGFHYNRNENILYKFLSFVISISSSVIYLLGNYIFNDNTVEILSQFPKFPPVI